MKMRRSDREVTEPSEILAIIRRCKVCRLAMRDINELYIIPMNFGYDYEDGRLSLYFHSAKEGRKLDILRQDRHVAFEMDCDYALIEAEDACGQSAKYACVTGIGEAEFVGGQAEKRSALAALMLHQTGRSFSFPEGAEHAVEIIKVSVKSFSAKRHQ